MNKKIWILFAFNLLSGTTIFCQQAMDIDPEKKAIIGVLEKESEAVMNLDYTGWSETWLQDETAIFDLGTGQRLNGFKEIDAWLGLKKLSEPFASKMEKANYKMKIYDKSAWVAYDELIYNKEGKVSGDLLITKILENINGEWKIVYTSAIEKKDP